MLEKIPDYMVKSLQFLLLPLHLKSCYISLENSKKYFLFAP